MFPHCAILAIDLYYEIIHDICLLFYVFVKSRSYFVLLVFSTHAFICLLSVSGIYRNRAAIWLGNFIVMGCFCNFDNFVSLCVLSRIAKGGVY